MSELVVKDNALMNASYNLDLVEQRLILLAIVEARENGKGINANDPLTVHAETYINQFGVHRNTAYQALKDACKDLFARQFSYQDKTAKGNPITKISRWVSEVGYAESEALVSLIFAPAVVPLITRLEEQFTKYEIEQISGLNSAYAVRLYELLICWRSTGKTPMITLADFRKRLGILNDEYTRTDNLKARIIDLSITQINEKTDISVSYEQHKSGRNIIGFSFKFKQKAGRKLPPQYAEQIAEKAAQQATQHDASTPDFFIQLTDKQIDLLVRSDLFLADFHELYGASDDYATARVKLRKKLIKSPEKFGKLSFDRYK